MAEETQVGVEIPVTNTVEDAEGNADAIKVSYKLFYFFLLLAKFSHFPVYNLLIGNERYNLNGSSLELYTDNELEYVHFFFTHYIA